MATHSLPLIGRTDWQTGASDPNNLLFGTKGYIYCVPSIRVGSQSLSGNTTTLEWSFKLYRFDNSYTGTSTDRNTAIQVSFGGNVVYTSTNTIEVGYNVSHSIGSGTTTITHNSDGTYPDLEIKVRGVPKGSVTTGTFNGCSSVWTVDLPRLLRADTINVSTTSTLEAVNSLAVNITRLPGTNYSHNVYYRTSNGTKVDLMTTSDSGLSKTFTLPATLASYTTTSMKFDLTIYCQSYSGSTALGETTAVTSCTIPDTDTFRPKLLNLSYSDLTSYHTKYGQYLQSLSRLKFTCLLGYAYNATLRDIRLTFDNQSAVVSTTSEVETSYPVQGSGNVPVSIKITDSRGLSSTYTDTVPVTAYAPPIVTTAQALRKTQGGVVDSNGAYVGVDYTFLWTPLGTNNKITYELQYRDLTTAAFSYFDQANSSGSDVILPAASRTYSTSVANLSNELSTTQSYEFRLYVSDTVSGNLGYYYPFYLYSVSRLMHFGKDGESLGIGAQGEFSHTLNVGYSLRNPGGIRPVLPPTGSNINDLKTPTTYVFKAPDVVSGTLPTDVSGNCSLEVIPVGESETTNHVYQRLRCENTSTQNKIFERLYNGLTWTEWYTIGETTSATPDPTPSGLTAAEVINLIYPVGSIYLSYGLQDPNTFLPGTTWELLEEGQFLRSASRTGSVILGSTGGSATSTGTSTSTHKHLSPAAGATQSGTDITGVVNINGITSGGKGKPYYSAAGGKGTLNSNVNLAYTDDASVTASITVDTIPPYLAVYMWKRKS